LEYHNVDPQAGLYHGMTEEGDAPRFTTNDLVNLSKHTHHEIPARLVVQKSLGMSLKKDGQIF